MEIVPNVNKDTLSKEQIEYLQKKQQEYKLVSKVRKCPGHILFSFNTKTKEIKVAEIKHEVKLANGMAVKTAKIAVEPDCYYEQALNEKNFIKRLKRKGLLNVEKG